MSQAAVLNAPVLAASSAPQTLSGAVRGFALYVGVTEEQLAAAGTSLSEVIAGLKAKLSELTPESQSHATLAVAPAAVGGRDIDVTRLALGEPSARAKRSDLVKRVARGVTVDLSRSRVLLDDVAAPLTVREFELLQFFVEREGQTVTREDILAHFWQDCAAETAPNARTIDVHIRRLRVKLGAYQDIIRTVRGSGYRFDSHPDVRLIGSCA